MNLHKYAVMRHHDDMKSCRFVVMHDEAKTAKDEAVRLMLESVTRSPDRKTTYYVVQIRSFFSGGPEGFTSSEGKV